MFGNRRTKTILPFVTALLALLFAAAGVDAYPVPLSDQLRTRIENERARHQFTCRKELICGTKELPRYYASRAYRPIWIENEDFITLAESLIEYVHSTRHDGLNPHDYHLVNLQLLLKHIKAYAASGNSAPPDMLIDLELLLTDAFLLLGSHLLAGRVDPEIIHTEWVPLYPEANLTQAMQTAIDSRQIAAVLNNLTPPHTGYRALKKALQHYREIEKSGGWPRLPVDSEWNTGDSGARYAQLRRRLELVGDIPVETGPSRYLFDNSLERGLRRFQYRHGLKVNGRMDKETLALLNVGAAQRVKQIELNLERWRWIPHEMGRRRIEVNIADYRLDVIENEKSVLSMRVVVGREYRKTPVFSEQMTYMVINPYWNIPQKLAYEDILPRVRRNPGYLKRRNIKVFESWHRDAPEIDPKAVDWSGIKKDTFVYKFRKEPGPYNDLGRIKFMFPNKFAVYLHDTPSRKLFSKTSRSLSSGCIRIEKPIELAEYLLRDDPRWTREKIEAAIKTRERQVVRLPRNIPVHLLYRTVWVDSRGLLQFREDIYNRDNPLFTALTERPPQI